MFGREKQPERIELHAVISMQATPSGAVTVFESIHGTEGAAEAEADKMNRMFGDDPIEAKRLYASVAVIVRDPSALYDALAARMVYTAHKRPERVLASEGRP